MEKAKKEIKKNCIKFDDIFLKDFCQKIFIEKIIKNYFLLLIEKS